jgi:hypothetical protein
LSGGRAKVDLAWMVRPPVAQRQGADGVSSLRRGRRVLRAREAMGPA